MADAIVADRRAIDRLIASSPTFGKLRNPVLGRVMGRLATFSDADRAVASILFAVTVPRRTRRPLGTEI